MNGYEATALIRSANSGVNPAVPIVALTAHAMQGDREKCLAAGMDDYVAKPVSPDTLAAAMRKWLPPDPGTARTSPEDTVTPAPLLHNLPQATEERKNGVRS
jgi:DNA-binding response OmpR family regulator